MKTIKTREEALAEGLSTFYPAVSCKNGHVDDRYTSNGRCVRCQNGERLNPREVTRGGK